MVTTKLFVEGGGNTSYLHSIFRKNFSLFLEKAGLKGRMPRIIACGPRYKAFDAFRAALKQGDNAFLLVDSEVSVNSAYQNGTPEQWLPFSHLREHDGWDKPEGADETRCHLMTQCMETWLIADTMTLRGYFKNGFNANGLPSPNTQLEIVTKDDIFNALAQSTSRCTRPYTKGECSFKILGEIDPNLVTSRCLWAKRFIEILRRG